MVRYGHGLDGMQWSACGIHEVECVQGRGYSLGYIDMQMNAGNYMLNVCGRGVMDAGRCG